MFLIRNPVQRYAWGSPTALADLLGLPFDGGPQAELWLGANPVAPSVRATDGVPLTDLIRDDPIGMLGPRVAARYGELPFLLKVLAAAEPLSIQAHPSSSQAKEGWSKEEAEGIPVHAPHRIYRDPRAKPEMLCALDPFEMLCGFREPSATVRFLEELRVAELSPVLQTLRDGTSGLREVMIHFAGLDSGARARAVDRIVEAGRRYPADTEFSDASRCIVRLGERYPADVGVLVAVLLEHIILEPGDAVYLPARTLHSYVEGTGIEIMGNSDNVVRAGLTPKHVDVEELMRILLFEPVGPQRIGPSTSASGVAEYSAPTGEFRLAFLTPDGSEPIVCHQTGPEILLCMEGSVGVRGQEELPLSRGDSAFVPARTGGYRVEGVGRLVRTSVPEDRRS